MKFINHFILLLVTLIFIVSCSNETVNGSNSDPDPGETFEGNYFPSTVVSYWKYDVASTDNSTNETIATQDSLYVVTETATAFMLDVNNGLPANGPIIGLLSSGTLTKTTTTLSLDGALELPAEITDLIDFEIALNNFVIYNAEASNTTQLASNANTITQDFNGFPLTIAYQLTSTALGFQENLSLNGVTYSNVVSSEIALNLSVSTTVEVIPGFPPITLSILDGQDILVSTNYFADGIGLVQADSNTSYQISATAITTLESLGIALPIPSSGSTAVLQNIAEFNIAD